LIYLKKFFTILGIFQTLLAVLIIAGCFWAANWQWSKGARLARQNGIVTANLNRPPVPIQSLGKVDPNKAQWQEISLTGNFELNHQFLIKNQYSSNGIYGFDVAQLFKISSPSIYPAIWIDRGWVQAGQSASSPPNIPALPNSQLKIVARIRAEALIHEVRGSFIATGTSSSLMKETEHLQGQEAAPFYADLISTNQPSVQALSQEQLPDLSTGPHYAYAFQWWLFALIALVGRIAILREAVKREESN
jgi:cytochrome oxidase assembly protein ShyY1